MSILLLTQSYSPIHLMLGVVPLLLLFPTAQLTQGDLDGGETMGYTDELLQRAVSTISCTTLLLHVHVQGIK